MARRCKKRRVCSLPRCQSFAPEAMAAQDDYIIMTIDEYECIRLMDFEGMTQAECAALMCVARTTVQAIYESARSKLASLLVEGKPLSISGGAYDICDGRADDCPHRRHFLHYSKDGVCNRRKNEMKKIAVTYENGQIFQHFGHTEAFKIYDVKEGKVSKGEVVSTNGSGHGALADFLKAREVDTLICGGIGAGAQNALVAADITLYGGAEGDADAAVQALLEGNLSFKADITCSHHEHHGHHGNGHACGEHGCHS
ncbi:MAG: DUF134 domain-containing protein [Selenomonadaceae bacterium]|nr:DUF134 domain-containing protein [Selenomonadaceae bacterium]